MDFDVNRRLTHTRIAENQSAFRRANERIEATADAMGLLVVPFVCECPDGHCEEIVRLTMDEYESVRVNPRCFFTVPGHEARSVAAGASVVVESFRDYVLVDKVGIAGIVASAEYEDLKT
jgi:hypothetical protein